MPRLLSRRNLWAGSLCALLAAAAAPARAHHSFAAEFDKDKPVKIEGTVTKLEWTNPHIWIYVDVKESDGKVTTWGFSGAPPGVLQHRGILKTSIKIGDVIRVEGLRAKDGSNNASGDSVTFPDGRRVFTAASEAAQPQ
jgi:uncharacterized protein DUF6152